MEEKKYITWSEFCRIAMTDNYYDKSMGDHIDEEAERLKKDNIEILQDENEVVTVYLSLTTGIVPAITMIYQNSHCLYFHLTDSDEKVLEPSEFYAICHNIRSAVIKLRNLGTSPRSRMRVEYYDNDNRKTDKWDKVLEEIIKEVNQML